MIRIRGLTRRYGTRTAVEDLSLEVAPGQVCGLLGPNGAGKTTTIRCLVGLLRPHAGTLEVGGHDVVRDPLSAKAVLSFLPEDGALHEALTPRELLALRGRLFGLDERTLARRTAHLLECLDLAAWADTPCALFSRGMRQKTALAMALATDPEVLVLDEPLTGLDVTATLVVKELLAGLAKRDRTILYSSHLLDVVEKVCDRVAILARGRLLAEGSVDDLREQAVGRGADATLDAVFRQLTAAADPAATARRLLEGL